MGEGIFFIIALMVICSTACRIVASVTHKKYIRSRESAHTLHEYRRELESLAEQFDRMERRMENIETIVVENEKHRAFDQAL